MKTLLSLSKIGSCVLIMASLSTAHAEIAPRMGESTQGINQQSSETQISNVVSEKIAPRMGVSSVHISKQEIGGAEYLATVAPRMKVRSSLNDAI